MDLPKPPDEPEVKNIIDKLANFVARNGLAFERMTKEKQKNNPKFAFLFGGQHYNYYQYKLTTEQQILNQQRSQMNTQQDAAVQQSLQNAPWQQQQGGFGGFPPRPPPQMQQGLGPPRPLQPIPPWQQQRPPMPWQQPPHGMGGPGGMRQPMIRPQGGGIPPGPTPLMMVKPEPSGIVKQESDLEKEEEEVERKIKESEDNLQQQHEVLMNQQTEQIKTAVQKAEDEHRLNIASEQNISLSDFDRVLQPIIDSCTKDSIANGKSWILMNGASQEKCNVLSQQLLYRVSQAAMKMKLQEGDDNQKKMFDTQLHLIYLINDVLHHASRKNLTNLSNALESVIVPIFAVTDSCANEQHQQRLNKLLGLWSKFNYFSTTTMDQLSSPKQAYSAYQKELEERYSSNVQDIKNSIQKQYEQFEKQHNEYANHIREQIEKKRRDFEEQRKQDQPSSQGNEIGDRNERSEGNDDYRNSPYQGRGPRENMGENPPWNEDNDGDRYYDNYPREPNFERRRPPNQGMNFGPRPPPPDWRNEPRPNQPDWDQGNDQGDWGREGPDGFNEQNWGNRRGPPPGPGGPMGPMKPDDPALIPKVPYYDLPAGLMAPLVNLEDMEYKELDPALIRLPPPVPPSDRLLAAVEAFYGPPSHERPRNPEGWEHNGLFEFFRAKVRAKRRADQDRRNSRSRSPETRSYTRRRSYSRSSSRSSSRSRSSRSRSRSTSRSPGRGRRATPPQFGPAYYQRNNDPDGRLDDQNRGAQMMRRMGWGGAGLGSSEQGIQDPVNASDVRDKYDQYKGLGMDMNDPYENFRKTRSYGYGPRARGREVKGD